MSKALDMQWVFFSPGGDVCALRKEACKHITVNQVCSQRTLQRGRGLRHSGSCGTDGTGNNELCIKLWVTLHIGDVVFVPLHLLQLLRFSTVREVTVTTRPASRWLEGNAGRLWTTLTLLPFCAALHYTSDKFYLWIRSFIHSGSAVFVLHTPHKLDFQQYECKHFSQKRDIMQPVTRQSILFRSAASAERPTAALSFCWAGV